MGVPTLTKLIQIKRLTVTRGVNGNSQILLALIKGSTYPGNVSQVEQVVYLGWCRKHFSDDGVVDVNGGLKETHNKINIGTQ